MRVGKRVSKWVSKRVCERVGKRVGKRCVGCLGRGVVAQASGAGINPWGERTNAAGIATVQPRRIGGATARYLSRVSGRCAQQHKF